MIRTIYFTLSGALALGLIGCADRPTPTAELIAPTTEPVMPVLAVVTPTTAPAPVLQSSDVVAELAATKITRAKLDGLLYQTFGLQMVFDLMELELAKNTKAEQDEKLHPETKGTDHTLPQADIDHERDIVFSQMFPDAQRTDYANLYDQFLTKEKLKRVEFEMRAIETSAYLRSIVEPIVTGKFSDQALRRGYEIMYGANRQIADITLGNTVDANIAVERLKTQPFEKVAREMSIDKDTKDTGGLWEPFSATSRAVPQVILESAFSLEVGQVSDILQDGGNFHIIKVLSVIEPKIVKFEDVKDAVRKQMEDKLIEKNMKALRQQLQAVAQQQIKFDDPILKDQWDKIIESQKSKSTDKDALLKGMGTKK